MSDRPNSPTSAAAWPHHPAKRRVRPAVAIPLLVVSGLLVTAAFFAYRKVQSSYLNRNESAAIATLKNISSAQAQLQATGLLDCNGNGQGEYGFFAELAGGQPLRGTAKRLQPPVLSRAFATLVEGRVERSGYVFQMFLPDREARGVAEDPHGGDVDNDNGVDPAHAETMWCCYAWPAERGFSGSRIFFIGQGGDVLATNGATRSYEGRDDPCTFDAAFAGEARLHEMVAANTLANDGNFWVVV